MPILDVPGAQLHHTVHAPAGPGSAPLLLTIPGGAADGGMFAPLAPLLATERTVITYDPRGLSGSAVDDPDAPISVATQAEDARRLLDSYRGEGPVDVLGSSGGALTGLELVTRHPGLVRTLVVHEPPLTYLLSDYSTADDDDVMAVYRRDGVGPATLRFLEMIGVFGDGPLPPASAMAPMLPNFDVFFGRMWDAIGGWRADLDALRAGDTRVVVALGAASTGQLAERSAAAFARALGVEPVVLSGDHGEFAGEPDAFAAALRDVLVT